MVRKGEIPYNWKGSSVGRGSMHDWVREHKGRPNHCEINPEHRAKWYHWANKDHKYRRCLDDYIAMCPSCHMFYDFKMGFRKPHLHTDEERRNMSRDRKGRQLSLEHRKKISLSLIGKPGGMTGHHHSDKARAKMSTAHKGHPGYWQGKYRSEETKRKISETVKKIRRK